MKYATEKWAETKKDFIQSVEAAFDSVEECIKRVKTACGQDVIVNHRFSNFNHDIDSCGDFQFMEIPKCIMFLLRMGQKNGGIASGNLKEWKEAVLEKHKPEGHWYGSLSEYRKIISTITHFTPEFIEQEWAEKNAPQSIMEAGEQQATAKS
jgi:hypothetical protein